MSPTRPFEMASRGQREPLHDPRDAGQEPELVEARRRAASTAHLECFEGGVGGHDDDRGPRTGPPQQRQRGEAVTFWHEQVEDDDVGTPRGRDLDALLPILGFVDDGTLALERGAEQQTNVWLVVTDQ